MKIYLALICVVILYSCHKTEKNHYEIMKVELRRSGPISKASQIAVDSSLTFNYWGAHDTLSYRNDGITSKKNQYYTGKIDISFWDTLNKKLTDIKYKTMPESDATTRGCDIEFELIIHWKNKMRKIYRLWPNSSNNKDSVSRFISWLSNSHKNVKLKKVDAIKFENPFPILPRPKINPIKFLPPELTLLK